MNHYQFSEESNNQSSEENQYQLRQKYFNPFLEEEHRKEELAESEETSATIVTKKIKKTKAKFLDRLFDVNQIKEFVKKHKLENIIIVILVVLLFSHISYGYTINLHRTILLCIFTISFGIVYLSYYLIKLSNPFTEFSKDPRLRPLFSIIFISIFILSAVFIYKMIPYSKLKKYNFSIPKSQFKNLNK